MRDTCAVINASCSFGRVCLVSPDFCNRNVEQLRINSLQSSTPAPTGGKASGNVEAIAIINQMLHQIKLALEVRKIVLIFKACAPSLKGLTVYSNTGVDGLKELGLDARKVAGFDSALLDLLSVRNLRQTELPI